MLHFAKDHYIEIMGILGGFAWGWIIHSILGAVFRPIGRLLQPAKIRIEKIPTPIVERKEPTGDIVEMFKRRKQA